jgi:hypothetical protein
VPGTAADAVTDPLGAVLELIAAVEPVLDTAVAAGVVSGVAPGRNVRRRLAQALTERPAILTDGRSPAPKVAGSLLIALRQAGAVSISLPVCAGCGKQLRSLQRRGRDWYCGICGPPLLRCGVCGNRRKIAARDRRGQPRCHSCPPVDDPDPMQILLDILTTLDPMLDAATVTGAVQAAAPRAGQRRQLAWALHDRPGLLTGAGAQAPVPSVLRLIDALIAAGSGRVTRPPCPHCGRVITLSKTLDGARVCRNCLAKSRAQACSRCGIHREPATRDGHGRPLCPHCLSTDPSNLETCLGCARRRPVSIRTSEGPLCPSCRPAKVMTCSICGRSAACEISKATGQPWCTACQQRWARCTRCGEVKPVRGGTLTAPFCATCTRPEASFWRSCPACGHQRQLRSRSCARCSLRARLSELLGGGTGEVRAELQALHENLVTAQRPDTVMSWLNKNKASAVLRELGAGERALTHAALDELPVSKPIEHLRAILVATSTLPPRDEHLARLERWIAITITGHREQPVLHRYAVWHLLRRLRGRNNGRHATHAQAVVVQQHVRAAIALLGWLSARQLTLGTARQGDLERWLTSDQATGRREAGNFVRWARHQKLTGLDLAAVRWDGPTGLIDTEARWQQARRFLHDDTLKPEDRVAGLLVLLYAQRAATLSRLTLEHVQTCEQQVRIRLGREPVLLPEPLAALILVLVATRQGHAALGDQGTSPWLFPGGQPGRPISADRLAGRLRQLGLRPSQARSTALFQLATELPAALLARMLGIHISVAVAWQRASSGDWTNYAADYSRRAPAAIIDTRGP